MRNRGGRGKQRGVMLRDLCDIRAPGRGEFFYMDLKTRAFVRTTRAQSIFKRGQVLNFVKIGPRTQAVV